MKLQSKHLLTCFLLATLIHGVLFLLFFHKQVSVSPTKEKYHIVRLAEIAKNPEKTVRNKKQPKNTKVNHKVAKDDSEKLNGDHVSNELSRQSAIRYEEMVIALLQQKKQYPRIARRMRMEGTARIFLNIDADGNIKTYLLKKSTGYDVLDDAVRRMVDRAAPFPPIPNKTFARLEIPIRFSLSNKNSAR